MSFRGVGVCLILTLGLAGCGGNGPAPVDREAKITAALDQLEPADRQLAKEQKFCAVETENRLGSMGKPVKVMLQGQPVFLCCEGCVKRARKDPEKTLTKRKLLETATREEGE
jgi:hypothetical protein